MREKKWSILLPGAPREKWVIFAKRIKIVSNSKVRGVSLFCKNSAKFLKNLFGQNWSIFALGGQPVYNTPFCPLPLQIDDDHAKNRSKMHEKWIISPQGTPPGKMGIFAKIHNSCSTAKYVGFHYFPKKMQNSRKTFLGKIDQVPSSMSRSCTPPHF